MYETRMGEPFLAFGRQIRPFSKALIVRLPGKRGGLIWNRPASLLVTEQDGQERVIPIIDVTRTVIWNLLGAALAWTAVAWFFTMYRRKK